MMLTAFCVFETWSQVLGGGLFGRWIGGGVIWFTGPRPECAQCVCSAESLLAEIKGVRDGSVTSCLARITEESLAIALARVVSPF